MLSRPCTQGKEASFSCLAGMILFWKRRGEKKEKPGALTVSSCIWKHILNI